jgi:virginiamycin B lyase
MKLALLVAVTIVMTLPVLAADVLRIPIDHLPIDMTIGPDGNVWVTTENFGFIYRVTPDGQLSRFKASQSGMTSDIVSGPDGALWYTSGRWIGRITTQGVATEYPVGDPPRTNTHGITVGSDGALWFGRISDAEPVRAVGRMTTEGTYTLFGDAPSPSVWKLALGGDGNVWFTTWREIWKINTEGEMSRVLDHGPSISGFEAAPDGSIWSRDSDAKKLVRIAMDGTVTEYLLPEAAGYVQAITFSRDGATWFAGSHGIGRIQGLEAHLYAIPSGLPPGWSWSRPAMSIRDDGRIWIAQYRQGLIPSGQPPVAGLARGTPEIVGVMPEDLHTIGTPMSIPATGLITQIAIVMGLAAVAFWRMRLM